MRFLNSIFLTFAFSSKTTTDLLSLSIQVLTLSISNCVFENLKLMGLKPAGKTHLQEEAMNIHNTEYG